MLGGLGIDQEDIIEGRVEPPFQCLGALGKGLLKLLLEEAVEGLELGHHELAVGGQEEVLPVEDAGVVVEALQDFQLAEGPGVQLLERLHDAHDDVGQPALEEVEALALRTLRFLEGVEGAVPEVPQLPIVLFFGLASLHQ